jgi:pimeloyl-ACP methyl ester carboxylesterase
MSIEARPVYFKSGRETLFGWLHLPPQKVAFDLGIVICKPFGYESICAHGSIRAFADACASAGAAVLRFDYTATGDSSGSDINQDEITQWSADIGAAAEALRLGAGVTRIGLLGIRFGALLAGIRAAEDPAVELTIAVAPVVNGRRYLRELKAFHVTSTSESARLEQSPAPNEGLEITGFELSQASIDHLTKVDLTHAPGRAGHSTLILDRDDLPSAEGWARALQSGGTQVTYQALPGLSDMIATPHAALVPQEMVSAVLQYLADYRRRLNLPAITAQAPMAEWPASMQLTAEDGSRLLEHALFADKSRTLFAIATELHPDEASGPKSKGHGVVMLNGGATSHIGPNRMYVELARRWAARGYRVLRLDLAGLGDSATRPGERNNEVYPRGALADVSAAIEFLRREYGAEHITLMGLCAGAYHALRSAISGAHINTVLLVNPLTFYWKQGSKLSDMQDAEVVRNPGIYAERVLSGKSWRKLLRGRVNLWRVMMVFFRRALLTVSSSVRDLSRRLNIRLPQDLGWELQSLATRGVRIIFMFARDDVGQDLLRLQAGSTIKSNSERCRVHIIDGADHVFSQKPARSELLQLLTSELPQQ